MRGAAGVWAMAIAVCLAAPGEARAGHAPPPTHSMALDSVASFVATDLLRGVSIPQGRPVVLLSCARGDTMALLTTQLVKRLRSQNVPVRLVSPWAADPADSLMASGLVDAAASENHPLHLDVQVDGSGVSYLRRVGSFPFGTKGYERLAAMRANATLLDPANGEVLWTRTSTGSAIDLVPKNQVVYAASGSGRLNPPVPRGGTRWLEPMIVVGVVAGLVVLFYSNRN